MLFFQRLEHDLHELAQFALERLVGDVVGARDADQRGQVDDQRHADRGEERLVRIVAGLRTGVVTGCAHSLGAHPRSASSHARRTAPRLE